MMKTRRNHITKQSLSLAALKNSWKCFCFFNLHILSIRCVQNQSTFIDAAASLCKRENLINDIAGLLSEIQSPANSWWLHSQKARSWNAIKKKRWIVFQATLLVSTSFAETFHWWSICRGLDCFCFNNHVVMEVAEYTTQSKRQKILEQKASI